MKCSHQLGRVAVLVSWFKVNLERAADELRDIWNVPKKRLNSLSISCGPVQHFHMHGCTSDDNKVPRRVG